MLEADACHYAETLAAEAWQDAHATSSPQCEPQLTLPYPSTWPPSPQTLWTRYAYAVVVASLEGSVPPGQIGQTFTTFWARSDQRGLHGVPKLTLEQAPLRNVEPAVTVLYARDGWVYPLGPELLGAIDGKVDWQRACRVAGAYLFEHARLPPALVSALSAQHAVFFRWLAEQEPSTPAHEIVMRAMFSWSSARRSLPSHQPWKAPVDIAGSALAAELERRHSQKPLAGRDPVELRLPGEGEGRELPLRLLILSELSREAPRGTSGPLMTVTSNTLDDAMAALVPSVSIEVQNCLEPGGPPLQLQYNFRAMSDFDPVEVAKRTPGLRELLDMRAALVPIRYELSGNRRFRNAVLNAVTNPALRPVLQAALGVVLDDSAGARMAAREEDEVARDEAASTTDALRVAALTRHRSLLVRRAACENLALGADAIVQLGPASELLEAVASNPAVWELAANGSLLSQRDPCQGLFGIVSMHAPWTDEVRRFTATATGAELLTCLAMEMPLAPGERGVRVPRRGLDRFERIWSWSRACEVGGAAVVAFGQAPYHHLEPLLAAGTPVEEQLRRVAARLPWLWREVALHPQCPEDVLDALAAAPQMLVRRAVASHSSTPARVVRDLASDHDVSVSEAAYARLGMRSIQPASGVFDRGSVPRKGWSAICEALDRLVDSSIAERTPDVGEVWEDDGAWLERLLDDRAAKHDKAPSLEDVKQVGGGDAHRALWLAMHPRASGSQLLTLETRTEPFIRAVLRHRL